MIIKIGEMIQRLRKELLVTQGDLARGLMSEADLSRLENGEKDGDCFLISALFQRLGKSMDQFEMSITDEEYTQILLRAFLQESMESKEYNRAREFLEEYEKNIEDGRSFHMQYVGMIRAVLDYIENRDVTAALEGLREALRLTFLTEGLTDWSGYCFYIQEIQLLLLIAFLQMEQGEDQNAILLLEKLSHCIDERYTSEVSKVQVYPKCCYLLARAYQRNGETDVAMRISEKGLACLKESASLIFMEELLELQQACKESEERREQLEAIRFAYQLVEYSVTDEFLIRLLFSGIHQEVTLSSELLREVRKAQLKTQEEVSAGICARETLARVENGRAPHMNYWKRLLTKLNIDRDRCYTSVVTDSWEVLEQIRDYKRNNFMENQEDALEILASIENKLDLSIPVNRQYVELAHLRYQIKKKQISNESALVRLKDLLLLTMPDYRGKLYRVPYREEFFVLNRMALCLKKSGKYEEAIQLYEDILQKYKASKVQAEEHANAMRILYLNYFATLFEDNKNTKAESVGEDGLKMTIKYQRGDFVATFLANIACVYEQSETQAKKALVLPCLKASYSLFDFYGIEKKSCKVKQYAEKYYA